MQTLKEYIKLTAGQAWNDFWAPFHWFTSARTEKETHKSLKEPQQTSSLWKSGVTLVSASLASAFIFFTAHTLCQHLALPTASIGLPALKIIWSIGLMRIVLVLLISIERSR